MNKPSHPLINKVALPHLDVPQADAPLIQNPYLVPVNAFAAKKESLIFADILSKLSNLKKENQVVVSIGPNENRLTSMLMELCQAKRHRLIFVGSQQRLDQLPNTPLIKKIIALEQRDCKEVIKDHAQRIDVILAYGILPQILKTSHLNEILDDVVGLLAAGGQCLLGDLPNFSKHQRSVSSKRGVAFKQTPLSSTDGIDDTLLISSILGVRARGFDAYLLPQREELAKANRREDILVIRP